MRLFPPANRRFSRACTRSRPPEIDTYSDDAFQDASYRNSKHASGNGRGRLLKTERPRRAETDQFGSRGELRGRVGVDHASGPIRRSVFRGAVR